MGSRVWPALVLLALVVLAPTAALTWLVGRAADNERLAARERLRESQDAALRRAAREVDEGFQSLGRRLDSLAATHADERLFGQAVKLGLADSVVCLDARGGVAYPRSLTPATDLLEGVQAWQVAERLEHEGAPLEAAEAFAEIADASAHPAVVARARLAQARCLRQGGQDDRALAVLMPLLQWREARRSRDPFGRLLVVDAGLFALMILEKRGDAAAEMESLYDVLSSLAADYETVAMPAAQRRFLGRRLVEGFATKPPPAWLLAEELAADFATKRKDGSRSGAWRTNRGSRAWYVASPRRRAVLLFREATIRKQAEKSLAAIERNEGLTLQLISPSESAVEPSAAAALGFPSGWRLAIDAPHDADTSADRQIALYGWATALTIGAILAAGALVGGIISRQHRVSRLQNDWLASVSHELKTPLASIRLLTESLADGDAVDSKEYLRLIGQETGRLGRLIDGMLAFSRIEQREIGLDRQPARPEDLAERAAQLIADRLEQPGCRFVQRFEAELPEIHVDRDALIAVLVNLLDNAWKFTRDDKEIELAVERAGDQVCFRVSDNGVGLAPGDAERVFRRFFQVDRRLSRRHGGCGLGLSLVRLVVHAHGGEVRVDSELGKGSKFSVLIPTGRVGFSPREA